MRNGRTLRSCAGNYNLRRHDFNRFYNKDLNMTATQSQIRDALKWFNYDAFPGVGSFKECEEMKTIRTILQSALDTQKPAGDALTGDSGGGDLEADTKKVIHLLDNGWKPVFNPPYEDTKYTLNKLPEGVISSTGFEKLSFEDAVTVQRCLEKVALTADNAKRGE